MPYRKQMLHGEWTGSWIFYLNFLGKRFRKVVRVKTSAVQELCRKWEKDTIEYYCNPMKNHMLFEKIDEFLDYAKKSKNEILFKQYQNTFRLVKKFFDDIPLSDFKKYHIEDYKNWRKNNPAHKKIKEYSNATINRDIARISNFFTYCIEREYYKNITPTFKTKLKESERIIRLTKYQILELFEKANERLKPLLMLAIYAGLRRNEILNLKWNDMDFENKIIHLPSAITKGNKERIICIPDILVEYLISYKELQPDNEYIIIYKNDKINNIKRLWSTFRKKLSFQKLSNGLTLHFHDLRHVYGQILKDAGLPMTDIQHQMGHSSISTTEKHYTQLPSIYIKDRINVMDDYLKDDRESIN